VVHIAELYSGGLQNIQMSGHLLLLIMHHGDQGFIPLPHLALHLIGHLELTDQGSLDAIQIQFVGPDHVLHLVHVQ